MSTPLVSLLSTLITMGVLVLFGVLAPSLSRPTVPLGVSVPSDRIDDPRVRSSIRRYRALAAATGVVAFAGSLATSSAPAAVIGWSTGYLVALWLVWIVARRPITEAKSAEDWYAGHDVRIWGSVSDAKPRVGVRWGLHALALLILAGSAATVIGRFDTLPTRIPEHYGADGQVDRWADKSWGSLLAMPVIGLVMVVGIAVLCAWMASHRDPQLPDGHPVAASRAASELADVTQVGCAWLNVILAATFALLGVALALQWGSDSMGLIAIFSVVATLVPVLYMAARGTSIQADAELRGESTGPQSPDEDRFWKGGAFYVNPDDRRMNVPKRSGMGYTLNMAHPGAKVVSAVLLLVLVGCCVLPFVLG